MSLWCFICKKLFCNFGYVTKDIQRSGQPGKIRLWVRYKLFPFKTVINLSHAPNYDKDDPHEESFCKKHNIMYYGFTWGAGGLIDWSEMNVAIDVIRFCQKPVWIHCEGGKDRTGGLIAAWKKCQGYTIENIFDDFSIYKIPAWPWIKYLFTEK